MFAYSQPSCCRVAKQLLACMSRKLSHHASAARRATAPLCLLRPCFSITGTPVAAARSHVADVSVSGLVHRRPRLLQGGDMIAFWPARMIRTLCVCCCWLRTGRLCTCWLLRRRQQCPPQKAWRASLLLPCALAEVASPPQPTLVPGGPTSCTSTLPRPTAAPPAGAVAEGWRRVALLHGCLAAARSHCFSDRMVQLLTAVACHLAAGSLESKEGARSVRVEPATGAPREAWVHAAALHAAIAVFSGVKRLCRADDSHTR